MLKSLKIHSPITIIAVLLALLGAALSPLVLTATVSAEDANIKGSLCRGSDDLEFGSPKGCPQPTGDERQLNDVIAAIINIFSVIVGIIAVIMIIYGGLKFITSGGDSGRLTSAKQTILYAIIGLIIVALAQFVVRFVLSKADQATS